MREIAAFAVRTHLHPAVALGGLDCVFFSTFVLEVDSVVFLDRIFAIHFIAAVAVALIKDSPLTVRFLFVANLIRVFDFCYFVTIFGDDHAVRSGCSDFTTGVFKLYFAIFLDLELALDVRLYTFVVVGFVQYLPVDAVFSRIFFVVGAILISAKLAFSIVGECVIATFVIPDSGDSSGII